MPMYNYECDSCSHVFEELTKVDETTVECPTCGKQAKRTISMPAILTHIIPAYPGCRKQKAGHVHSHADRPATKIQSGYGGCASPK